MFGSGGDGGPGWEVGPARIDVRPDGFVVFVEDCDTSPEVCSSTAGYVTLDGVSFRPVE